jgi:methyl-accepting chemotaxis protein I, serine sensor receptor
MTIKARLGWTMLVLGLLLALVATLGLIGMDKSNEANHQTFARRLASSNAIGEADLLISRQRAVLDRVALHPDAQDDAAQIAQASAFAAQSMESWKQYLALPHDPEEDRLAHVVQDKRDQFEQIVKVFVDAFGSFDQNHMNQVMMTQFEPSFAAMTDASSQLKKYQYDQARHDYEAAEANFGTLRLINLGAAVLGFLAAFYGWYSLKRVITKPLRLALDHLDAISKGDLTHKVDVTSTDEMGQLLSGLAKMRDSLIVIVSSVTSASESIATATREIAAGNIDLSARTEQQAASLQRTAASMGELTTTVKDNAANAHQANALASSASDVAVRGNEVVGRVVSTMNTINSSSSKIIDIIGIIEGIAFQTNILALNAAVEAARAGEQGRGFAVVASEVRSLAQRSAGAAREIKDLIAESVERVRSGTELVGVAGATMTEVVESIHRVNGIMGEISSASDEQSRGIDQVNQTVSQIDEATQQNAALVEQATAAAQSLEDQAQALKATVAVFRIDAYDDGATPDDAYHAPRRSARDDSGGWRAA